MPCTIQIDRSHHVSYMRLTDIVTYDAIAAGQDLLRRQPTFDPTAPLLVDLRDTLVELTQHDMLQLAERTPLHRWTRLAILVNSTDELELARTYEFIRELQIDDDTARACLTIDEALAWLGVHGWQPP